MVKTYKVKVEQSDGTELILWVKAESIFGARSFSGFKDNQILSVIRVNAKTGQPIKGKW